MSRELVQVGDKSTYDFVKRIQLGRDEGAEVLGRINIINGVFIPPDLKKIVSKYGQQSQDVKEVMAKAINPVQYGFQFEYFRSLFEFDPNSNLL